MVRMEAPHTVCLAFQPVVSSSSGGELHLNFCGGDRVTEGLK
jgi:hypothetical protein